MSENDTKNAFNTLTPNNVAITRTLTRPELTPDAAANGLITRSYYEAAIISLADSKAKLKLFHARSDALYKRIATAVQLVVPVLNAPITDLGTKPSLVLLLVLIEEIDEYFRAFSCYSRIMTEHLIKFGVDEEVFSKWNERL